MGFTGTVTGGTTEISDIIPPPLALMPSLGLQEVGLQSIC